MLRKNCFAILSILCYRLIILPQCLSCQVLNAPSRVQSNRLYSVFHSEILCGNSHRLRYIILLFKYFKTFCPYMNVGFTLNRKNAISIHYDKIKLRRGVRFPIIEIMFSARQLNRKVIFRDSPLRLANGFTILLYIV